MLALPPDAPSFSVLDTEKHKRTGRAWGQRYLVLWLKCMYMYTVRTYMHIYMYFLINFVLAR